MGRRYPSYLRPYLSAGKKPRGIQTLLWASSKAQRIRFDAIVNHCPLAGRSILDVGCGRADLLAYLWKQGIQPSSYTGIEILPSAIEAARRKRYRNCRIVETDFVQEPQSMWMEADVIVFCGSLNTLPRDLFYETLARAWWATENCLAFNFLCSPKRASAAWLTWHDRDEVIAFAGELTTDLTVDDRYLDGDCTIVMSRQS